MAFVSVLERMRKVASIVWAHTLVAAVRLVTSAAVALGALMLGSMESDSESCWLFWVQDQFLPFMFQIPFPLCLGLLIFYSESCCWLLILGIPMPRVVAPKSQKLYVSLSVKK